MNSRTSSTPPEEVIRRAILVNILIGLILSTAFGFALFWEKITIYPFAPDYAALGIYPATFNVTFLMTIGITRSCRVRVIDGRVRSAGAEIPWFSRWLPQGLLVRALAFASALALLLASIWIAAIWLAGQFDLIPASWTISGVILFYSLYFATHALIVTPVIMWRGLSAGG